MPYSIDEFKGQISKSRGFARPNLFQVILPPLTSNTRELDLVCKAAALPGRQITSLDMPMGTTSRKIANGYAVTDISLTFYVLNDHGIREYFETWQALAHDNVNYEIAYYNDYVKNIKVRNLQKGNSLGLIKKQLNISDNVPSFILNRLPDFKASLGPLEGNLELSQGEASINLGLDDVTTYEVELLECYPTTVNEVPVGNDIEGVMELNVQLSYKNWSSNFSDKPRDDLFTSIFGGLINLLR